jgi:hypothetical protein
MGRRVAKAAAGPFGLLVGVGLARVAFGYPAG